MIHKKIVLLLLTYTVAHCSNHGILSLPKEILGKIVEVDEAVSINDLNELNKEINKFQLLQRNSAICGKPYEHSLKYLIEIVDKEKETIVQCISLIEKMVLLSRVSKGFYNIIINFYPYAIKSNITYLQHYMKDEIYDSMKTLKKVIDDDLVDFNEMYKKVKRLKCYLDKKIFIRLVGSVDTNNSMLKQYLPSALYIPDHMINQWAESGASSINILKYYTDALYCLLQFAFERRSNNIIVCTSEQVDIHSKLIHKYLNISVRFAAKKNGLYYYIINKRSNTINKESNVGFFIKKDSNQSCVIS